MSKPIVIGISIGFLGLLLISIFTLGVHNTSGTRPMILVLLGVFDHWITDLYCGESRRCLRR